MKILLEVWLRQHWSRYASIIASAFFLCFGASLSGQQEPGLIDKITKVWQAREDRCAAIHVEWTTTTIVPAGWHSKQWAEISDPLTLRAYPNNP